MNSSYSWPSVLFSKSFYLTVLVPAISCHYQMCCMENIIKLNLKYNETEETKINLIFKHGAEQSKAVFTAAALRGSGPSLSRISICQRMRRRRHAEAHRSAAHLHPYAWLRPLTLSTLNLWDIWAKPPSSEVAVMPATDDTSTLPGTCWPFQKWQLLHYFLVLKIELPRNLFIYFCFAQFCAIADLPVANSRGLCMGGGRQGQDDWLNYTG